MAFRTVGRIRCEDCRDLASRIGDKGSDVGDCQQWSWKVDGVLAFLRDASLIR